MYRNAGDFRLHCAVRPAVPYGHQLRTQLPVPVYNGGQRVPGGLRTNWAACGQAEACSHTHTDLPGHRARLGQVLTWTCWKTWFVQFICCCNCNHRMCAAQNQPLCFWNKSSLCLLFIPSKLENLTTILIWTFILFMKPYNYYYQSV